MIEPTEYEILVKASPRRWRMRGEKIRTLASSASDPEVRAMMLGIAADYERRGKWVEERAKRMPTGPKGRRRPDGMHHRGVLS